MRGAQKCLLRSVIRPTSPSVDSLEDKAALGKGEETKVERVLRERENESSLDAQSPTCPIWSLIRVKYAHTTRSSRDRGAKLPKGYIVISGNSDAGMRSRSDGTVIRYCTGAVLHVAFGSFRMMGGQPPGLGDNARRRVDALAG